MGCLVLMNELLKIPHLWTSLPNLFPSGGQVVSPKVDLFGFVRTTLCIYIFIVKIT